MTQRPRSSEERTPFEGTAARRKQSPTRREFLGHLSALGLVGFGLPGRILRLQLPTREIPGTDERLPIVRLGSSKVVLEIPAEGTGPVAAVIRTLLDGGGRVVDTSPRTEAIDAEFGHVLTAGDIRSRIFLTTKINTEGAEAGVSQMRQMQRLWNRRAMDVVQVESMRDVAAHWPNLSRWKENGEARYVGVTVSSSDRHGDLEAFMRHGSPDFVQVNYSVVETGAEERVLPLARELGIAVLTNRPFMNGAYFRAVADRPLPEWAGDFDCVSWAQFSLKYILSNTAVTCALAETTSPEHMAENAAAGLGRLPGEALRRRMREVARNL